MLTIGKTSLASITNFDRFCQKASVRDFIFFTFNESLLGAAFFGVVACLDKSTGLSVWNVVGTTDIARSTDKNDDDVSDSIFAS